MTYYDTGFQHHGILGQKWGVITKNVGVNYVPVGARSGSSNSTAKKVLSGAADAVRGTGKALIKGAGKAADKIKVGHEKRVAEKAKEKAYHSGYTEKLSKKDIAKMSNQEIADAIRRRETEKTLYEMDNPTMKAGREFFDNYVKRTVLDLTGQYGKKMLSMYADKALRDFIMKSDHYDDATKRDLLNKLDVENLTDRLAREAYESSVKTEKNLKNSIANDKKMREMIDSMTDITEEQRANLRNKYQVETDAERFARENAQSTAKNAARRASDLNDIRDNIAYEMNRVNAIRQVIDQMYDNESERSQARIRNNVATEDDLINDAKRKAIISSEGKVQAGMSKIPGLNEDRARMIGYGFSKLDNA